MTDRIQIILKTLNLSPSQFADEIDVQRSSVSHILSGRNKPSLDFVNKILTSFPEVSPDWLLFGKGGMHRKTGRVDHETKNEDNHPERKEVFNKPETVKAQQVTDLKQPHAAQKSVLNAISSQEQEVSEIIIFYHNNTFKVFKPTV